jgi:hypothetical protein
MNRVTMIVLSASLLACPAKTEQTVVEPVETAEAAEPKPEVVIPVLGMDMGLPDRPEFLVPVPPAIYEDGTWSIRGLRSVLEELLPEAEQDRVVRVTAWVQEVYQQPECPEGVLCPPGKMPHAWLVDDPGVRGKQLALMLTGTEFPIPEWDEESRVFWAGAQTIELEVGRRYVFMGWFRRFTESGFGHDAGLLELLAVTDYPAPAKSLWIVPINSQFHPRARAARGMEPLQPVDAEVPEAVKLGTSLDEAGPPIEPRDAKHALELGHAAARDGLPLHADWYYRWLVVHWPDSPTGWVYLANFYADWGEGEAGKAILDIAIARRPDDAYLHNGLGRLLLNLGKPAEAVVSYRRAVELAPDKPDAWFGLGMAYAEVPERERAIEALEQFLEVGGDSPEHVIKAAQDTIMRMQGPL